MNASRRTAPILRTKLHRPPVTDDLIWRRRLHDRLNEHLRVPMVLISAPAGYGKSVLASQWAASLDEPCAWITLDPTDTELSVFASYVVAAIRTYFPEACGECDALIEAPVPVPVEVLACNLLNGLDAIDGSFLLVLDDYHNIAPGSEVHGLIQLLNDHPTPKMRLILTTRRDPPLPIASWRARGTVAEVRLNELKFTTKEISDLLSKNLHFEARGRALTNLEEQTEGWIVAIRLLFLYARHLEDPGAFFEGLEGGIRDTRDYLIEEVLSRQTGQVRDWLLRSSILDRFCPELCEVVGGRNADPSRPSLTGQGFLATIHRESLFTIALDSQGEWYRYHHLFQELLQKLLQRDLDPAELSELHLRAAAWFEENGYIDEALDHALRAEDVDAASETFLRHRMSEIDADRWYVVERWFLRLRPVIEQKNLGMLMSEAWIALFRFQIERIPVLLEESEPLLADAPADSSELGEWSFFQGCFAYWDADAARSIAELEKSLTLLPGKRGLPSGICELYLGMARCMDGEKDLALQKLEERIRLDDPAHDVYHSQLIGTRIILCLVSADAVRVHSEAERLRTLTTRSGIHNSGAWCDYLQGGAYLQAMELERAEEYFALAAQDTYVLEPRAVLDSLAALALSLQLQGRSEESSRTLSRMEEAAQRYSTTEDVELAESCRARIALLRGESDLPLHWALRPMLPFALPNFFLWLEVPALTQARVLIRQADESHLEGVLEQLQAIRSLVSGCHYSAALIEVRLLESLALARLDRTDEALASLKLALEASAQGHWGRPFFEAGAPLIPLLQTLQQRGEGGAWLERLLEEVSFPPKEPSSRPTGTRGSVRTIEGSEMMIEELTDRELDILKLLSKRLYNKEIAEQLCISSHTVNDHLKHIYQKLGVHNRREAVRYAVEAQILKREPPGAAPTA